MLRAGINVSKFAVHSIRSTVVSKAKKNNVPVDIILKTAGWTNSKTFAKLYDKTIQPVPEFDAAVLK